MDAPDPVRASASGRAAGCAKVNSPFRPDKSPQPALAWDANSVRKTPAVRVVENDREMILMKFLFSVAVRSAYTPKGALSEEKLALPEKTVNAS
jgi:hypothetical protein